MGYFHPLPPKGFDVISTTVRREVTYDQMQQTCAEVSCQQCYMFEMLYELYILYDQYKLYRLYQLHHLYQRYILYELYKLKMAEGSKRPRLTLSKYVAFLYISSHYRASRM